MAFAVLTLKSKLVLGLALRTRDVELSISPDLVLSRFMGLALSSAPGPSSDPKRSFTVVAPLHV